MPTQRPSSFTSKPDHIVTGTGSYPSRYFRDLSAASYSSSDFPRSSTARSLGRSPVHEQHTTDEEQNKRPSRSPISTTDSVECPFCDQIFRNQTELVQKHFGDRYDSPCGLKYLQVAAGEQTDFEVKEAKKSEGPSFSSRLGLSSGKSKRKKSPTESPPKKRSSLPHAEEPTLSGRVASAEDESSCTSSTGSSSKSPRYVSIVDDNFTIHDRSGSRLRALLVASEKHQFTYGGKSACTSICMEAAIFFLHHNEPGYQHFSLDQVEEHVKTGCLLDPQQGNLSFAQLNNSIDRFKSHLKMIHSVQGEVSVKAFRSAVDELVRTSNHYKSRICAIVTKPPETIMICTIMDALTHDVQGFLAFDSHPRKTDGKWHGAHVLQFIDDRSLLMYLCRWLFPQSRSGESNIAEGTNMDEYSMFDVTYVTLRKDSEWEPFTVEDQATIMPEKEYVRKLVDEVDSLQGQLQEKTASLMSTQQENERLREENDALETQVKERDSRIEKLLQTLRLAIEDCEHGSSMQSG